MPEKCPHPTTHYHANITTQAIEGQGLVKWLFVGCTLCGEHLYNGPFRDRHAKFGCNNQCGNPPVDARVCHFWQDFCCKVPVKARRKRR